MRVLAKVVNCGGSSEVGVHADLLQLKMNEHVPICTPDTEVQVVAWEGDSLGASRGRMRLHSQ